MQPPHEVLDLRHDIKTRQQAEATVSACTFTKGAYIIGTYTFPAENDGNRIGGVLL